MNKDQQILKQKLSRLNENQIQKLREIFSFKSYQEFLNNNKPEDIEFLNQLGLNPETNKIISSRPIISLISRIQSKYSVERERIITEIQNELNNQIKISSSRTSVDCSECHTIYNNVYIEVLNQWYYVHNASIEEADRNATVAAQYAFLGCVLYCTGNF